MADPFTVMSGVGSLLGGVAGLFGSRRKNPTPRDNMMSQAQGARDAAEAYGFNPLTMLQYGNPGGTGLANNGPPLASFDLIANGFKEIGDVVSGDADRRRAQEDAKLDLAKLEIERLRAGKASDAIGAVSPLGRNTAFVGQSNVRFPDFGMSPNPLSPEREKEVAPVTNSPGFFEMNNALTGGDISIPGDGEPWGIDELATAIVVGAPQVVWNKFSNLGSGMARSYERSYGFKPREGVIKAHEAEISGADASRARNEEYDQRWKSNAEKLAKQAWKW
ncbi:hypothetical protein [Pseudogemmobacter bohemicus]|uniref:hypothetical protein n=1 Tax=Pseudogemmobacter bohemicus TaxID=2250708 RepID=UPI000DD36F02|nr:hypothetical protein [Pseudogemmobacter bohemicus]